MVNVQTDIAAVTGDRILVEFVSLRQVKVVANAINRGLNDQRLV
ncbi:hypothetical protein [Leptolyngbya sp. BC1307]|nr:hypothetical protein [Leptolyngbya sp. BC1307]